MAETEKENKVERLINLLHDIGSFSSLWTIPDSEFGEALYERLRNPIPGDIVVEISSFRGCTDGSVGIFMGMVWDMNHPDGEKQHKDYYLWQIEDIYTGAIHNWGNARFLVLPTRAIRLEVEEKIE